MSDTPQPGPRLQSETEPPIARVTPRRFSFAWLLPLAVLAGIGVLVWQSTVRERGPVISIAFPDADGLRAGDPVRHRGVTVGVVRTVALSDDLNGITVTAELDPDATPLASSGTRFWVVRPELSLRRVAGLETILGPRYINAEPGTEIGAPTLAFRGLPAPPRLDQPTDALSVMLNAERSGPVRAGAPVLFRDLPVGVVRGVELADNAASVEIEITIDRAYAPLVRENTRFWAESGVGVDWGLFRGLSVRADSLDTLIDGAVAFATPNKPGDPVTDGHAFTLAPRADDDWRRWKPEIRLGEG